MVYVDFENHIGKTNEPYIEFVKNIASYILEQEGCPYDSELSLVLTDNKEIRQINLSFREIDNETDVLSFPNYAYSKPAAFDELDEYLNDYELFNPENNSLYLGDIMISDEKAKLQAKEFGHTYTREFAFLLAHSILHLIGYDHMTQKDAKIMENKQKKYLDELGLTRDNSTELV